MGMPDRPRIPSAPPAAPDPADVAIREAAAGERRRQMAGAGRKSTFLSGLLGDMPAGGSVQKLLGN